MAFCAGAQTLYLMGAGDGLSWDQWPGRAVNPGSDGSYNFTIDNLTSFKMSTAQASNWDDFNAGALGYSGGYTDAVYSTAGQTVSLSSTDADQIMPATGSYTITINAARTSMTVKANFAKPAEAPAVYIRGAMNSWGSPDLWKFTYDAAKDQYTFNCEGSTVINGGVEFKIADSTWGNINYSTGGVVTSFGTPLNLQFNVQNNTKFNEAFSGTITFKITGSKQATATFTKAGDGPVYPDKLFVIGTINGGAFEPTNVAEMSNDGDGFYSISSVTLGENGGWCGFAITGGGADWNEINALRFGPAVQDTPAVVGENQADGVGDYSWSFTPGTYSMVFDINDRILTIEGGGDTPVNPNPKPDPDGVETIYIMGGGDGLSWDAFPGLPVKKGDDGAYSVEIDNLVAFKITTNGNATSWDSFNEGAIGANVVYTDAVFSDQGQTVNLQSWGENQTMPWVGTYKLTVAGDLSTLNVKTSTPKPVGPADVYVRGDMNEWLNGGADPTWQFTYNEAADEYTFVCEGVTAIEAGQAFKFADMYWGTVNYTYGLEITPEDYNEELVLGFNNSANTTFAENFTGTIVLKIYGEGQAAATFMAGGENPEGPGAVAGIDAENAAPVFYNLQGQKVANPDKGIYIKVAGGKAVKVVK